MECSAFTAPWVVRQEHWLGITPQCFSTVFHTVHLGFAQIGKRSNLIPPPNSRVKLMPGVVTTMCVKTPILGTWAVVMLQLELEGRDRCCGCAWSVAARAMFVQCSLGNSPALLQHVSVQAGSSALWARLCAGCKRHGSFHLFRLFSLRSVSF